MKTVKQLVSVAVISLISAFSVNAQTSTTPTKDDLHKKLTLHHTTATEHANKIKSGATKTTAEHKTAAIEAGKHLNEAKAAHKQLKASIPANKKAAAQVHHDAIDKHHTAAEMHHKELTAELSKTAPDAAKVKSHATGLHTSLTSAEKEHQALKEATK